MSIVNHLRFIFYAQRLRHLRRSDPSSDTACSTYFEIVVWIVHLEEPCSVGAYDNYVVRIFFRFFHFRFGFFVFFLLIHLVSQGYGIVSKVASDKSSQRMSEKKRREFPQ